MPAKQIKPNPEDRRRARREVLRHKPKGILQLSTKYRNLDVLQIRDVSPFGLCLLLKYNVDKGARVNLKYIWKGIQIGVTGTVAWRKVITLSGSLPTGAHGCLMGIFFHPGDIDANFALYQALREEPGPERRGKGKSKRPA